MGLALGHVCLVVTKHERYNASPKGLARSRRYNVSACGKARMARYRGTSARQMHYWLGEAPMALARELVGAGLSRPSR